MSDYSHTLSADQFRDHIVTSLYKRAKEIEEAVVTYSKENKSTLDDKIDSILTSRLFGFPIMLLILALIFWITIVGANFPSKILADLLFSLEDKLTELFINFNAPSRLHGIVVLGMYRTAAWVISVMLPPMAIFFPCFTLLEDLGYLPRVAFNLDRIFKKAGAHGKQALTMAMGFGCNAAGVISSRIIDSPRERLIAILTNNFVPCNGRFPTLIAISMILIGASSDSLLNSLFASGLVVLLILLGIAMTFLISFIASKSFLKGTPSRFSLELPPYRKPQIGKIIIRSIFDRTLFVLGRAVAVALPAGAITWLLANISIGNTTILNHIANFLDPFALWIGLDGVILLAFFLGLPANEIVLPIIFMIYLSTGSMIEIDSIEEMRQLFLAKGWTHLTCLNVMLFSLLHFPCGTTLWTIKKETQSVKWALASFIIPTLTAILICFISTQIASLFF
ncbi:MAG TPA: nucleoside recognition domain-containing protein [Defluviitaleaceae bacterium]|nr:nucleoside recognition domain-containing protein [Defluviitaleaceae bacterium]HPT77207.1 nucleoside recognition domain-containing protein [Defluviitaleaceae bacterium]HQD50711.1 nucleoside recognition domain-containing protein [Defluviitaleaceae bacterium]